MKITDEMVNKFLDTYTAPGFSMPDPTRVRWALEAALGSEEPEYEWAHVAVGQIVVTDEHRARVMAHRWGDRLVRREVTPWETVEQEAEEDE
jgi:hypothetical protein